MSMQFPSTLPEDPLRMRSLMLQLADSVLTEDSPLDRVELLEQLLGAEACRRLGIYRWPAGMKLSVVVPVYNEAKTVEQVVERIKGIGLPCEILLIDDGSTDGTDLVLQRWNNDPQVRLLRHLENRGKGAALKTGFLHATGDLVVIQDADLEYDPAEFPRLVQPLVQGEADVVYGSRYSGEERNARDRWHRWGNRLITLCSNLRTGLALTDVETCHKAFRNEVLREIAPRLQEQGFGVELEITARLAKIRHARIWERPIQYQPRWYAEGKKITWRDALWAFWCVIRY